MPSIRRIPSVNKPSGDLRPDIAHPHLNGCTSLWSFQQPGIIVPDLIGSNHGRCTGNAVVNMDYQGMSRYIGTAGANDGVEIPNSPTLNPVVPDPATSFDGFTIIVDFFQGAYNSGYAALYGQWGNNQNAIAFCVYAAGQLYNSVDSTGTGATPVWGSAGGISENTRYVCAMSWTPGILRSYINGVQDSSGASVATIHASTNPIYLGGPLMGLGNPTHVLQGRVYQVRYYRRRLTAEEIYVRSRNMWAPWSNRRAVGFEAPGPTGPAFVPTGSKVIHSNMLTGHMR